MPFRPQEAGSCEEDGFEARIGDMQRKIAVATASALLLFACGNPAAPSAARIQSVTADPVPATTTFHWGEAITVRLNVDYDLPSGGCVNVDTHAGNALSGISLYPEFYEQRQVPAGSGTVAFVLSGTVPSQATLGGNTQDVEFLGFIVFLVPGCQDSSAPPVSVTERYRVTPN